MTTESEEEASEAFERWTEEIEARGMKVKFEKRKEMVTGKDTNNIIQSTGWPCG